MEKQRPEKSIKHGRVEAAIWANEAKGRTHYNVTFTRSYTEDDGKTWNHAASFGFRDCLAVIQCAAEAVAWVSSQGRNDDHQPAAA